MRCPSCDSSDMISRNSIKKLPAVLAFSFHNPIDCEKFNFSDQLDFNREQWVLCSRLKSNQKVSLKFKIQTGGHFYAIFHANSPRNGNYMYDDMKNQGYAQSTDFEALSGKKRLTTIVFYVKKPNLYCHCGQLYDPSKLMVECSRITCVKRWFHLDCAGLKAVPEGDWFCNAPCRPPSVKLVVSRTNMGK